MSCIMQIVIFIPTIHRHRFIINSYQLTSLNLTTALDESWSTTPTPSSRKQNGLEEVTYIQVAFNC